MNLVSRTLERVRGALRGRRTPGRHSRPATPQEAPQEAPQAPPAALSPIVLGARLVTARRTRRDRHTGAEWQDTPLVRPFLLHHLGEAPRNVNSQAYMGRWEAR
ncbi:hypothetical protein GCM10010307_43540 [Streptomyces vastus]|uniref:Integrase n=1 Tax=Streptomyces vastus TaxID=285451 RepID=A0ABN3R2H6_9ACTN